MATDVYQPCPCGSGKKYKFCCHPVQDEMDKIVHLAENGQTRAAISALEKLETGSTLYPQAVIIHANLLLNEQDYKGAKTILQRLLTQEANHPVAIALFGLAALLADGLEKARSAVYRAYLHGGTIAAAVTSNIAMYLATMHMFARQWMASREHLALAMRLAPENKRQEIFVKLLQFDGDRRIPYPFRSVHPLVECAVEGEFEKAYRRARRFCETGCFAEAHKSFISLAEQHSDPVVAAPLWHNAGYTLAWDGQEKEAADALHKAGKLYQDRAQAIECETLAQLLDMYNSDDVVNVKSTWYPVESVSRLLTVLGDQPRYYRRVVAASQNGEPQPVAEFDVLDRAASTYSANKTYTLDDFPRVLSRLSIFDRDDAQELPGRAYLTGYEGNHWNQAYQALQELSGSSIDLSAGHAPSPDEIDSLPRELLCYERNWLVPEDFPGKIHNELDAQHWRRVLEEIWPNMPLYALGGATAKSVTGDDAFRNQLTAAIYVVDAMCDTNHYHLSISELAARHQVEPLPPLEVSEAMPLQSVTALGLHRLPFEKLSDKQLSYVLNRVLLVHHGRLLHDVFSEVLKRPECMNHLDLNRFYMTMAELSRERFNREERLSWIEKGQELAKQAEKAFEKGLEWCMREVAARLDDPQDSKLNSLLMHMWNYYAPKLPDLRHYLTEMLKTVKLTPPWEQSSGLVTSSTPGTTNPNPGVWTPQSPGESPSGSSKIWLPGQD
ncbi:MAG: SEC-C metal-binding domain-containing protein [Planctomycetaceae bacterium]